MGKINHPLMSIEASGTIGKAVTFQHSGGLNIARKKPEIPYSLTLPQQYQRWLYQDYCAYWNTLTPAQKQVYATLAVSKNMSGFALFMRTRLASLDDIALWLPLDTLSGATTPDFSKNGNHGTVVGATLTSGRIDHAFDFNGTWHYINAGNNPSLNLTGPHALEAWVNIPSTVTGYHVIIGKMWDYRLLLIRGDPPVGRLQFHAKNCVPYYVQGTTDLRDDKWHHVLGMYTGTHIKVFVDGKEENSQAVTGTPAANAENLAIGASSATYPNFHFKGKIDHAFAYSRAFTDTEILLRSSRQFPHSL